ncbi:unnamed protein product [Soboliphyme baturini]|uniref:Homeobox domain-containing protein n=1 Tax=Soboliphyme baturini TaxID=241478 RepID=A0A183IT56_9BILA|nr:unnamed protein product [Soboliphyme baturini]
MSGVSLGCGEGNDLKVWFQNARAKYRRSLHVTSSSSTSDRNFVNAFSPTNFVSDAASDFVGESSSAAVVKGGLRHCMSFSDDSDANIEIYGGSNSGSERCGSS